jgi:hypothetical protein
MIYSTAVQYMVIMISNNQGCTGIPESEPGIKKVNSGGKILLISYFNALITHILKT